MGLFYEQSSLALRVLCYLWLRNLFTTDSISQHAHHYHVHLSASVCVCVQTHNRNWLLTVFKLQMLSGFTKCRKILVYKIRVKEKKYRFLSKRKREH